RRFPRRDRERAPRAGARAARAGQARRRRGCVQRSRGELRAAGLGEPSRGGVGRPRGSRHPARRRQVGGASVSQRCRGTAGRPVLAKEEVTTFMKKARLILLLVFAVLLAFVLAKGGMHGL